MNQLSKILILDDDVDLAGLIKIRLEGEGYELSVLHAPKDCLKEIYIFRPDLILLEKIVEALNYFSACEGVRN